MRPIIDKLNAAVNQVLADADTIGAARSDCAYRRWTAGAAQAHNGQRDQGLRQGHQVGDIKRIELSGLNMR